MSSAHTLPDSGECPQTSFKCLSGRCLPPSWRCNGQVECLDERPGLGTDELGCDEEVDSADNNVKTFTERNHVWDSDRRKVTDNAMDKQVDRFNDGDIWGLGRSDAQVEQEQTRTHKALAVTPTPIDWPCGGLLQTFYGTFSPPASQGPALYCVWTIDPQDPRPLRLDLQQLVLGPGDRLTVYNGEQGNGEIIKIVSLRN